MALDTQQAVLPAHNPRQLQPRGNLIQFLVVDARAAADGVVDGEHRLAVERLLRQHVTDELQIRVALAAWTKEQLAHTLVDRGCAPPGGVSASERIARIVR